MPGVPLDRSARLAELLPELEAARRRVANHSDPCFECECCARYALLIELLAAAAQYHLAGELRVAPCHPACLICSAVEWQGRPA